MKRMARPVDDLPIAYVLGRAYWGDDKDLDVSVRERVGQVVGVLFFTALFVAVALLSGGPS